MGGRHSKIFCPLCRRPIPEGDLACARCGRRPSADQPAFDFFEGQPSRSQGTWGDDPRLWLERAMAVLWLAAIGGVLAINPTSGCVFALVSGWIVALSYASRKDKGCLFGVGLLLMVATSLGLAIPVALYLMCLGVS